MLWNMKQQRNRRSKFEACIGMSVLENNRKTNLRFKQFSNTLILQQYVGTTTDGEKWERLTCFIWGKL